ncbi:MAG: undecaprenyldiphospho-muramoylpentapeptide beta-N-acetylglucosaminyltransferase [Thermoanaerobaculia bacterium]
MSTRTAAQARILLVGGGTAGHVFPGLAVAEALLSRGWQAGWLGRPEGMEKTLVASRGLPYYGLDAGAMVGRGLPGRLKALGTLVRSSFGAARLIKKIDARVVLGTGGFVSAPGILGARMAGRATLLLEPNAAAGVANRWLSRFVTNAAVGFAETGEQLKCPVVVTGVPIRAAFGRPTAPLSRNAARRVVILGGSQGARQLNRLMPRVIAQLRVRYSDLQVLHQVGAQHLEEVQATYGQLELSGPDFQVVRFIEDMAAALAAAHLVVSRAGAVTLAEICAIGRAAALVPLDSAGGHQRQNAQRLAQSGGAVLLETESPSAEDWSRKLEELLADVDQLEAMGRALRGLSNPEAAERVADLVEKGAMGS